MRKSYRYLATLLMAGIFSIAALAQNVVITGTVRNGASKEPAPSVSVTVKGTGQGTYTDGKGNFKLTIPRLPVTLVFSSVGYEDKEVAITTASGNVDVDLTAATTLGQEVVIAATRTPQRILESPVSIERMSSQDIRNVAVPNYYDAVANLKGVDLTTSSLTFRTPSTRGFNGSGNLRFNQLIDGIDNQAPGLNFSVGSIVGPTSLDVDNMELLPGASSALYGSGGMNGTLLINSKNPFKYQGFSYEIRQGMMHVDGRQRSISPYYDWAMRWSKKVGERFAFKISSQLMYAHDWQAQDYRNLQRNNVFSELKGGDRASDPNYDGVNVFGDEASANLGAFGIAGYTQVRAGILAATANTVDINPAVSTLPANASIAQINSVVGAFPAALQPTVLQGALFWVSSRSYNAVNVSRTGYEEKYLVDYNAYNLKLNGGVNYKITDNIEASLLAYWGTGTTVYTGADRYAIKNLKMGQYKLEVKGKNWFLRGYTVQENSGDAYTATTAAIFINRAWKPDATWFGTYDATYTGAKAQGVPDIQAHAAARAAADAGRFLPGTTQFNNAFQDAKNTTIGKGGAKFFDRTDMYHFEGQLNLTQYVKFAETLIGTSFRQYRLNSHGTIFSDTTGVIPINEFGAYLQLQRWFFNERLKLTASGRYDKNENFAGRFTPRATALIKIAKDNNLRLSYQQAYRFPSTQDQYINLLTGGVNRLIGMGQVFRPYYQFDSKPGKTAESVVAYRNSVAAGTPNPGLLVIASYPDLKPETMNSYEIGYRGLVTKKLLFDAYLYYSQYKDFIARVAVGRGQSASSSTAVELTELASPFTTSNFSFVVNSASKVNAIGWGVSADYEFGNGFHFSANVSGDRLNNVPAGFFAFFNTPKVRYNIGLRNDKVCRNVGFNVLWRWQDELVWQGTFGTGLIPSYGTLDAQVSWRLSNGKSQIKIGSSNLLNKYYRSAFGNPDVGGVYYFSYGYNL
jgi:outer membrane receptor protein involved in Fe transport